MAIRPLTQTAPDEKSEAEQEPSLGDKPQVGAAMHGAPGRIRTCDTRFRRAVLYPLSYEGGVVAVEATGVSVPDLFGRGVGVRSSGPG